MSIAGRSSVGQTTLRVARYASRTHSSGLRTVCKLHSLAFRSSLSLRAARAPHAVPALHQAAQRTQHTSPSSVRRLATPFTFDDIPDQSERVAIVSGGNAGIGEVACLQLALRGAKVYMASRSESKAKEAIERIRCYDTAAGARVEWLDLDLADLANVNRAAEKVQSLTARVDILLNNAGIMATPYGFTKDGLEMQNGTNVVGHYLFTLLLLPVLARTAQLPEHRSGHSVRIVHVSSIAHINAPAHASWRDLSSVNERFGNEALGTWKRYGMSKQGNIYLAKQFKATLAAAGIEGIANTALHPGNIHTSLLRGAGASYGKVAAPLLNLLSRLFLSTPDQGALTSLFAATSAHVDEKKMDGKYLVPVGVPELPDAAARDLDGKRGQEMMRFCAAFVKEKVDVDFDGVMKATKEAASGANAKP